MSFTRIYQTWPVEDGGTVEVNLTMRIDRPLTLEVFRKVSGVVGAIEELVVTLGKLDEAQS